MKTFRMRKIAASPGNRVRNTVDTLMKTFLILEKINRQKMKW